MKRIVFMLLAMLTLGSQMEVTAQKWEWDGKLSNNETIDNFLLKTDTLYNRVKSYRENISSFQFVSDTLVINDKNYLLVYMLNSDGNIVTRGTVNWQLAGALLNSTAIVMDMTTALLSATSAALELPKLGLKALKFTKYVTKGAPSVIKEGLSTIRAIRGTYIGNTRTWKGMKEGAVEDPSSLNYFSDEALSILNKCCYIKEINKLDPEYEAVEEWKINKTPEEIEAAGNLFKEKFELLAIAPEIEGQAMDELPDDDDLFKEV